MANKLSLDDVLSGNFAKARLDDTKPSNTNKLSLKDVLAGNFNKKTTLPTTDPDIITPSRRSDNTRNKPKVINPEIKEGLGYMGKRAWTGLTQDAPAAAIQALGLSVGKAISEFNTESPITAFDKIKKADSFGDKLSAGLEGIVNYSPYTNGPAAGPAAAVPKTLANVAKGVVDVFTNKEDAEKTAEKIFNYAEPFVERSEEVQREGEKYPDWVQTGAKATGAVGMMLPSIALSALTRSPNVGLTAMSMMAGGSAGKEAYDKTGDLDVAWNYGAAAGVTEFATERMFRLMDPFLGASGADKAIKKMLSGLNDYKVVKTLLTGTLGATGEGIEEVIVELVDPYLRRATFDPNAPQAKKEDLVEVFTVGALAGLIMKGTMGPIQAIGDNKQRRQYVQQKADAANELASILPTEHRPEILEITSRTTIEEVDEYYGKIIDAANTAEQEIGKRDYSEYPLDDNELEGNPRLAEVREKYKDEVEKLESLYGTINLTPEQQEEATAVHSIDVATLEKEAQDAARDFYLPPKMRLEKAIVEGIAHKYYSPEVIRRYIDQKKEADKAIKPKVLVGGKQVDKTKFMSQLKEKDPTLEDNELEEMFIKAQLESSRNLKVEEFVMQTNEAFSQYGVKVDVSYYLPKQERGFYDPKTKTITLNAKTIKSRSVASYVLSHEITHYAIAKDPELLSQLKQSAKLLDYDIAQHNEGIRKAYEKRTGQTLSEEYLTEESIADFVSTVLQDDNLLMQLANKKPTTLQRVAQVITDALMYTRQDRAIRKYKKDVAKKLSAALEGRLVVEGKTPIKYSLENENVGYRAGKFGKSERYFNMMSGNRGTGHFGTGTYFVGDPSKIELEDYNKRTQHMVDFNGYNLFKPRTSQQAFDLHGFLKFVNYDNQKLGALNYSTDQIVEEKNKVYNATESILDFLSLYDFDKEKVFKASDEYFDFTDAELIKENGEYTRNKEIIKAAIANRALISWRAINNIQNEVGKGVGYKTPEWKVYNYYSGLQEYFEENFTRDILETQREVTERLNIGARVLGLTVEDLRSELQYINERYAITPSWFDEESMAQDTPATIFMKRLGYEGVDVRGLKEVDNTTYGSVIYDLNPSSIRYSLSPDFYNKSTKLIETKLPKNLNGTQTLEGLRNGQNIREEELKWTGLAVYLTEKGSEKVSKEELLEFIAANELPISEVTLKTVFSEEDWPEDLKQLHSEYTELNHKINEKLKSAINKVVDENITFELAYYHKDMRDPRVYAKDKNGEVITFGYASSHYNLNTLLGSDTGQPSLEGVQVPFVEDALKLRIHNELYAALRMTYDYEETNSPLRRLKDVAKSKLPSDFGEKIKQVKLLQDSFYDMQYKASRRFLWDGANKTIYDFLALKPDSNYKELLFHWDSDRSTDRVGFRSRHFNETGGEYGKELLMHARISDGKDVEGRKVIFIEELQSDWHEKGRREGYYDRTRREIDYGRIQELEEEMHTIEAQLDLFEAQDVVLLEEVQTISTMWKRQDKDRQRLEQLKDQRMKLREERAPLVGRMRHLLRELEKERQIYEDSDDDVDTDAVINAPFKETWHEFLLKRLIAKAAQEDYSRIAWTTGQQQIDRYPDMVKPIIWVLYSPTPDGDWIVEYKLQGKSADESEVVHSEVVATEQELKALVGKRITRDIVNKRGVAVGSEFFELSYPEVVQAGGEGMLNFYDIGGESSQNIARFMDKYGKQWGAKVEMAEIDGIMQPSMEITPEMRESVLKYGQELRYSLQTEQLNMFDNELLKSVMFSPIKEPLSDSQKWYFKDSAVRRKNGDLLKVYHGTRVNDLSVFGKGDIGFHFGTKSQAINRVGRGKNSHIIEAYLNIKNPLFIDADLGDWEANYQLLPELLEMGVFTAEEVKAVKEIPYFRESGYRSPAAIKIREMLAEKGYDGIKYLNWFEATGNDTFSYIAFYPEQIKAVNNFLPTSDPDIRYSLGSEAIDRFGTTEDYREVGYIMADGTMLDFSEKNNGGPGGTRTLDHRAIAWLYDDDSDIDGIEAVIAFVNDGNVRVSPEAPGIELSTETKPTSRQLVRIAKFVDRADDFFAVDFVDPNGDVVHPLFYEGEISTKKVMADINRFYGEGISGIRYALEMNDDAYLNAVNSGDMRSAQKLVDAMARKAGYTVKAYHGTRNQFTEFDRSRTGDNYGGYSASGTMFDFSTDKDTARAWGAKAKGEGRVRIVPAYLKVVKTFYTYDGPVPKDLRGVLPETLDAVTKDKIMDFGAPFKTYVEEELGLDWAETLYKYGYDSESMHKSYQATGDPISVYSPSQIKSADPVTYDENGEVIPLSQRFDKGNPDIRYSLDGAQDNTGSKITHQQHNYFKGTKVVDAQGKLKRVYHGTMSDFWEFSREHSNPESDMGAGYYFTDNEEDVWSNYATPNGADLNNRIERLADEYIINEYLSEEEAVERARRELMTREEPRTIEAYLKIEKPLILDWRNSTLFDFNMNYDEETGEYGEFEGTFVDFIESVVNVLEFHEATENYIEDMQELYFKFADDETIFAYDAINAVKEVLAFYEDPETGYLAANEIIRQAIEDMGFDGIIDKMVSWKWGKDSGRRYVMKGVSSDTTHYIIFDSSQAKEVDNLEPTNSQDLRHSIDDYDEFIKKWKDAQEKYGVKSPGMAPRIETEGNEVPRQFSDDTKASNLLRTTMESPNTPDDFRDPLKLRALSGTGSYLPVSDANALDIANNIITRRGISGATDKWRGIITGQKALNKSDIALGELLLIEAADRGDLEEWEKIVGELCAEATRAGQVVQAFSMLKKLSPQGRIYNIKALVTKLQDELDVRTKGKAPALKIRQELLDQLLQARTVAEMEAIEHEIIKEIAQQIPPRISDRVVAWRYLSMLGNLRTHIRNIVSNMFMMVERTLKDVVAATAEGVAGSINPNMQRTKTLAFASQEVRDFVRQDWQVMKPAMLGGGKLGFDDIFARYKKNFGKSVGGRMLNFLDKLNMEGLNVEDSIFMGVAYRKALASYLTANKFSTQFINSGTKEANEALARARKYAVEEGLKATYREANSLAIALNNIEQKNVATKIIVGGLMPFKKTPLNIIKRGVEYSLAGLLEAISIETIRLARGKITAAQYFDRLSSGLVGSAAFGLGMYLAFLGLAKAGGSDDKEEYYEQMLGNQPYSITVGGRNYTIDWLTPASMPLMAGVELVTTIMKDGKIDVDEIDFNRLFEVLITTADPLTELSMLQGINQALSGYGENRLGETVASAAQSYAGQFIPTLFGQAARTVDPVRRTTYAAKDTDFPFGKKGEQFVNKLINKADVLNRVEKEPYLDMWGREDIRPDNLALRALEQFVTPYYAKDMQKTAVDDELARVFQVNKATEVLPSTPRGNITIDGTTFQLSPKEYTEYKRKVGTQSHAILDDVFKTPEYRNLDQESKEAVIKKVYSYVKEDAKADYAEKKNIEYEAESVLEKVDTAKDAGIDMGTYFVTADQIQRIESDKNPVTGEGVRKDAYGLETRKTKVINYLKGLDITPEEKYAIYLMYYSK